MARTTRPPGSGSSQPTEDTATQRRATTRRRKLALASMVSIAILIAASVATSAATSLYSIAAGDTLGEIASEHGTDVETLANLNGLEDPDLIITGESLRVPSGELITYTVADGDTLSSIAGEFGVDMSELAIINKLSDPDLILPGSVLLIYVDNGVEDTATEANAGYAEIELDGSDENLERADESAGVETDSAGSESDETALTPDSDGSAVAVPSASGQLHLVQGLQTLAEIAAQYGVTEAQLIAANALDTAGISAGMILKIPAASSTSVELIGMPTAQEQWPLQSELAAASLATAYWGAPISTDELLGMLAASDNPHEGFRGNPEGMWGMTDDYGVYNEALAGAMTAFGFTVEAFYADGDAGALTAKIDGGTPVVVWVTHDLIAQERTVIEDESGRYSLIPGQHAVVVYGYNDEGVLVSDVSTGELTAWGWDEFMASWSLFDGMALSVDLR